MDAILGACKGWPRQAAPISHLNYCTSAGKASVIEKGWKPLFPLVLQQLLLSWISVTHSSCHCASCLSPGSFQEMGGRKPLEELLLLRETSAVGIEHKGEPPAQGGPSAVRSPCRRSLRRRCLSSTWSCSQAPEVPSGWVMPFQTEICFPSYKRHTPDWWLHVALAGGSNNSG